VRKGFGLIEALVATVVFMIGIIGLTPLLVASIKHGESLQKTQVGEKILEDVATELRGIQVYNFTKERLKDLMFIEYPPHGYPPVTTDCPKGYEYAMYRGYEIYTYLNNVRKKYKYTVKMCVDDDYLKPYLKRVKLWVVWEEKGKERDLDTDVYVTAK